LRKSNEYLASSHAAIKQDRDELQSELDALRPSHAALRRAHLGNGIYSLIAALVMTTGSGLISSPSYVACWIAEDTKAQTVGMAVFGSGWGLLGGGAVMLLAITLCSLIFDK
jgi:hypothetical protein